MRISMGVEYDGTNYFGWQSQVFDELPTLQAVIQTAISKVADQPITITAAGRTDKGVHATGQVIHFDTDAIRSERSWILGVNTHLPKDIAIKWAKNVPDDFHARYCAKSRRYQYVVLNSSIRSALLYHRSAQVFEPLNIEAMQKACHFFVGEHDFSSFRAAECQAKTPIRNVDYFKVERSGSFVFFEVQANAFLHHMVRNMVGTLIKVGRQEEAPEWIQALLKMKDRKLAAATAPASGLYLICVNYPEHLLHS